jgi:hypothetical protein
MIDKNRAFPEPGDAGKRRRSSQTKFDAWSGPEIFSIPGAASPGVTHDGCPAPVLKKREKHPDLKGADG